MSKCIEFKYKCSVGVCQFLPGRKHRQSVLGGNEQQYSPVAYCRNTKENGEFTENFVIDKALCFVLVLSYILGSWCYMQYWKGVHLRWEFI